MTCDLSVGTPRSTLAGGAGRMRRMTFLFKSKPFIVLVPPPTENSRSLGGHHKKRNGRFLRLRIPEALDRVQLDLLIIVIRFIYSTFLWPFQFGEGGQAGSRLMHSPTISDSKQRNRMFFGHFFGFVWPFLRSKTSSFLAPENDNSFVFKTFLGSFPLFSIFFLFSTHFPLPPRRSATPFARSLASLLMRPRR